MEMKVGNLYLTNQGAVVRAAGDAMSGCVWCDDGVLREKGGRSMHAYDALDAVADLGPPPTWKQVVEMREEVERLRADLRSMAANRDDLLQRNTELEAEVANLRLATEACDERRIEVEAENADLRKDIDEKARSIIQWQAEAEKRRIEVECMRAKLAKEADAPDLRTFADAPLHVAVADEFEANERVKAVFHFLPDGFTPHLGGQCPVNQRYRVHAFERGGNSIMADAGAIQWAWERPDAPGNIIGYRVVKAWEEAKPTNVVDLAGRKLPPIPAGWRLETDYDAEPHPEAKAAFGSEWGNRSHKGEHYRIGTAYIVPIAYDVEIPWHGGPCPVAEETEVVVTLGNGLKEGGKAGEYDWSRHDPEDDIVSYTVPAPKPAEPERAAVALDPTSVVFATRGMEVGDA